MKKNTLGISAFTLIEILIGITLFSIIVTSGFYAFSAVGVGKIKLIGKTDIEKESYFFSEKLFEEIKKGGLIDYEEYFNRKVVGDSQFQSGHYLRNTGFGNFGSGGLNGSTNYGDYYYFCRSTDTQSMGTGGCYNNAYNNYGGSVLGIPQRYGQYSFQFIDYNSNINSDFGLFGDEDSNGSIVGDDDDESIGMGPEVFSNTGDIQELYLISGDKKTRTLFRWKVIDDPDRPATSSGCNFTNPKNPTGAGCLGTIEYLRLNIKDWGINHSKSGTGLYDGNPETWIINPDFAGTGSIIAGSNTGNYRVPLFPKTINVEDVKFFLYPNKDLNLAWKDPSISSNFSPYLRIHYKLTPSREKRKGIRGKIPKLNFSTTITLSDLFSQK
ncbi:hypothetical protein EOM39_06680 [Candidatus Gracilibacteria bacterium]|nr:hypothetical protein [Candidatus Gracilibacteria bacterium]